MAAAGVAEADVAEADVADVTGTGVAGAGSAQVGSAQVVLAQVELDSGPGSQRFSRGRLRRLGRELARFGTVGAFAFLLDVGLFNVLMWGGSGVLADKPLTAKGISVITATTFAFVANRFWTYGDRQRTGYGRETVLFFLTNAAALAISWACLATSHYLMGLDSTLADNISANVIGVGLGTLFRFWTYRTWVFPKQGAARPVLPEQPGSPG